MIETSRYLRGSFCLYSAAVRVTMKVRGSSPQTSCTQYGPRFLQDRGPVQSAFLEGANNGD